VKETDPFARRGFVGYFDILGYREIEPRLAIEVWKGVAEKHKQISIGMANAGFPVTFHLFGDTILLLQAQVADVMFTQFCRLILEIAFEKGIPLRGAVSYGDYFQHAQLYSGRPIIEAHDYANALEVSACVLTPSGTRFIPPNPSAFPLTTVPMKQVGRQPLHVIHSPKLAAYSRAQVFKAFSSHDKKITPDVLLKVNNTVELLQQLKSTPSEKS